MLCSFDNQHAQQLTIMHAVVLDNQHTQQCNSRHAVTRGNHHAHYCNIMHAVTLECDTEQSSCTKLQYSILYNHYAKPLCKQQQQQKKSRTSVEVGH